MINLKNVSLVFQGGSVAISNISTKVEEGEFVYLVGHSGSCLLYTSPSPRDRG